MLGAVLTELDQAGQKARTYVYQGGRVLAWQKKDGATESVGWDHRDPSGASVRGLASGEYEPMGSNAGTHAPLVIGNPDEPLRDLAMPGSGGDAFDQQATVDGISMPYFVVRRFLANKSVSRCPNNDCGPRVEGGRISFLTFSPNSGQMVYGHWGTSGGGAIRETDKDGKEGDVIGTYPSTPEFVEDARAVVPDYDTDFFSWGWGQQTNPNCFQNAVKGSPGIGRGILASGPNPFSTDPNGTVSHDGWHALSGSETPVATTLAPLTGTVIAVTPQSDTDPKTLWNVYVRADGKISGEGFYIAYKDFPSEKSITVQVGQHLEAGEKIGTVRPSGAPADQIGLHITLVRARLC